MESISDSYDEHNVQTSHLQRATRESEDDDDDDFHVPSSVVVLKKRYPLETLGVGSSSHQRVECLIHHSSELLKEFHRLVAANAPAEEIAALPFPFCVFGTLRCYQRNNHLMGYPLDSSASLQSRESLERCTISQGVLDRAHPQAGSYFYWAPAVIPQTKAECLVLRYKDQGDASSSDMGCGTKAELFAYSPSEFAKTLPRVDALEGYMCGATINMYIRTLMWVQILPWSYYAKFDLNLTDSREWAAHEIRPSDVIKVPAWVYSHQTTNAFLIRNSSAPGKEETVIWQERTTKR